MAKINEIEHLDDAETKNEPAAEKSDPNFGFSGRRAEGRRLLFCDIHPEARLNFQCVETVLTR